MGTISENGGFVKIPLENISLLKKLTDCGIINSICSKNDSEIVNSRLEEAELQDYFVFNSINWDSKSYRLKNMIEQMSLRPQNVLFIDDNPSNLAEAKLLIPELQVCGPSEIPELIRQVSELPVSDIGHKRLRQYKVLETKRREEKTYSSNEDFLYASNIRVSIFYDCANEIDRISELVLRSNQLNFTKRRDSREELLELIGQDGCKSGYVKVKDKFGDYGIVGFFALMNGRLVHFVFSCRTLGQGIEQYVYSVLGFPDITVVGEVRTSLNKNETPEYINQNNTFIEPSRKIASGSSPKILLKGPCDLSHAIMYLPDSRNIVGEFTYIKKGTNQVIDTYNHSVHIEGLMTCSSEQVKEIIEDCPFVDQDMFNGSFFSGDYDFIFLSALIEPLREIYRNKENGVKVVFSEYCPEHKTLDAFKKKYECIGITSPEQYTVFLDKCLKWLNPKTTLCIILGSTFEYPGCEFQSQYYQKFNKVIKNFANGRQRLKIIEMDSLISSEADFDGNINHFSSEVYYKLAQSICKVTGRDSSTSYAQKYYIDLLVYARGVFKKVLKQDSFPYHICQKLYFRLTGKKDINR